jgi:hypothetical protein
MKPDAWHLPWSEATVPHAVLDICRGCNITCRACYNSAPVGFRSPQEVEADLDRLLSLRRLSSVTLVGGEVTLHPELFRIVSLVKARGLGAEVCTNGVLVDDRYAAQLQAAGTDIVYFHIEAGQERPDLPNPPTAAAVRALRDEKARLAHDHGLDAGLLLTAFSVTSDEILEAMRTTLESPHLTYLLVTLYRDVAAIRTVSGALSTDLRGDLLRPASGQPDPHLGTRQAADFVRRKLGLRPFAYVGSNADEEDPRWLSYLVGTARRRDGTPVWHCLKASAFERLFLWLSLRFAGRYPMYQGQDPRRFRIQLLANALTGGRLGGNLRFLAASWHQGAGLLGKRLLFQNPAFVEADGRVIHCDPCADAVLKEGRLVPVCISDRVDVDGSSPAGSGA